MGLVSAGDQPGVGLGVVSHLIDGEAMYEVGCFTILTDGAPAQRLTSVTGQNTVAMMPNAPGVCLAPEPGHRAQPGLIGGKTCRKSFGSPC